jgi:hypothetical protein
LTSLELLALVGFFAIVRVALSFRPQTVPLSERSLAKNTRITSSPHTVVREYLDALIVAGLMALLLITFVVRTFYIPSGSMLPTQQINDLLLVSELEDRFAQTGGTFVSGVRKGERAGFTGHAFLVFWPLNRTRILH